jgi:hypothetical protein
MVAGTSTRPLLSRRRSTTPVSFPLVRFAYACFIPRADLHLGYTQALRPGVKASFGLALDTRSLNEASHAHHGPAHKVIN